MQSTPNLSTHNNKLHFNHAKVLFSNVNVTSAYKLKITLFDDMNEPWTSCKLDLRKVIKEGANRQFLRMNVPMSQVHAMKPVISMTYLNGEYAKDDEHEEGLTPREEHTTEESDVTEVESAAMEMNDRPTTTYNEEAPATDTTETDNTPRATALSRNDSFPSLLNQLDYSKDLNISNIMNEFERLNTLSNSEVDDMTPRQVPVDDEVPRESPSAVKPVQSPTPQARGAPQQASLSTSKPTAISTTAISSPRDPSPSSPISTDDSLDLMERNTRNEILIDDLKQQLNEMRTKMRMLQDESTYGDLFALYEEDIAKLHTENQSLLKENQDIALKYQRDLLKKHSSNESLSFYVHSHYKSLKQENQQLKLKLYKLMQIGDGTRNLTTRDNGTHSSPNLLASQNSNLNFSSISNTNPPSPSSRSSIYREGNAVLRRKIQQLTEQLDETKVELQRERMQNTKLNMKLRRFAQGMSSAASSVRPYKDKIAHLKEKVASLRETIKSSTAENDNLRQELIETRQQLLESSDQYESLQQHMEGLLRKTQALEQERQRHQSQLFSLEGQLNESMTRYEELSESKKPDALIGYSQRRPVILPGERREVNAAFAKLALLIEDDSQALFALEHLRDLFEALEHEILDIRANELSYIELLMEYRERLQNLQPSETKCGGTVKEVTRRKKKRATEKRSG